jgi:hypothetical protein
MVMSYLVWGNIDNMSKNVILNFFMFKNMNMFIMFCWQKFCTKICHEFVIYLIYMFALFIYLHGGSYRKVHAYHQLFTVLPVCFYVITLRALFVWVLVLHLNTATLQVPCQLTCWSILLVIALYKSFRYLLIYLLSVYESNDFCMCFKVSCWVTEIGTEYW